MAIRIACSLASRVESLSTGGSALGLAICHGIVLSIGGRIEPINREHAGRVEGLDAIVHRPLETA